MSPAAPGFTRQKNEPIKTMNHTDSPTTRPALFRAALISLGCALVLGAIPALQAADTITPTPLADKAAALPLTATVTKLTDGTVPPYVLKLTNNSKAAVKVSGKVLLAVVHHNADKARILPEHVIEAGQAWTIPSLAAEDKVIVTSDGFATLEVVVK